jgi:hypothetical protein
MSYGKTITELRSEYAPYDKMPAFEKGIRDYQDRSYEPRACHFSGADEQAYDRGLECAMRMQRQEDWTDGNVGGN